MCNGQVLSRGKPLSVTRKDPLRRSQLESRPFGRGGPREWQFQPARVANAARTVFRLLDMDIRFEPEGEEAICS
jgi:hypothetical protein